MRIDRGVSFLKGRHTFKMAAITSACTATSAGCPLALPARVTSLAVYYATIPDPLYLFLNLSLCCDWRTRRERRRWWWWWYRCASGRSRMRPTGDLSKCQRAGGRWCWGGSTQLAVAGVSAEHWRTLLWRQYHQRTMGGVGRSLRSRVRHAHPHTIIIMIMLTVAL